jgi:hypothetical protein
MTSLAETLFFLSEIERCCNGHIYCPIFLGNRPEAKTVREKKQVNVRVLQARKLRVHIMANKSV